jgi:transposase InsO family protein
MYMAYSNNPQLPHVRMEAVRLVRLGWSTRKVARYLGYSQGAIVQWVKRAPINRAARVIPTRSSKPHHHPHELAPEIVDAIIAYRKKYIRDAFFIHHLLKKDGVVASLSSVKRTLKRHLLTYPSPWKKWHIYPPRPAPEKPGTLVEIDTIHVGAVGEQLYLYTLLDVCSRWAHAIPSLRITAYRSASFVGVSQKAAPFDFQMIQSDHGAEFSKGFTKQIVAQGLPHRHSRIRTPNDNAHLERFNRTIQDECIKRIPRNFKLWKKEVPEYLQYYNTERPHMGLDMKTPEEKIAELITSY